MGLFDDIPQAGLGGRSRDFAIRTILGEAGQEPDEGQAAVGAVIMNRLKSGRWGDDAEKVVLSKSQFEPWMTQAGRNRMMGYGENSPEYMRAAANFDRAAGGYDPTSGATHFYSPSVQAALGRAAPSWAQGEGQAIGRHTFFAPEGRVQLAQAPQLTGLFDDIPAQAGSPPDVGSPHSLPDTGGRFSDNPGQSFRTAREGPPELPQGVLDRLVKLWENPPKDKLSLIGMIKSAYEGATLPGDVATGKVAITGDDGRTNPEVIQRSAQLAAASPLRTAPGGAFAAPSRGLQVAQPPREIVTPNRADLLEASTGAGKGFNAPEVTGLKIGTGETTPSTILKGDGFHIADDVTRPGPIAEWAQGLRSKLTDAGLGDATAKKIDKVLSGLENAPADSVVTGQNLQSLRTTMSQFAKETKEGKPTPRAKAAIQVIESLDEMVAGLAQRPGAVLEGNPAAAAATWNTARGNYASAMRSGRIEKIIENSKLETNPERYIVNQLKAIIKKPLGWTDEEVAFMRDIVGGRKVVSLLGKASPNNPFGMVVGGAALATGGFPAAVVPAVGWAAQRLASNMATKQAERLAEMTRGRTPLANAMNEFEKAAEQFYTMQNPRSIAAVTLASRNLAHNLKSAGINLSPSEIMRALQGPMKSAAEDDQKE